MNMKNYNIKSNQEKNLFQIIKKLIQLEFNLINGNKNYKYNKSIKISEKKIKFNIKI